MVITGQYSSEWPIGNFKGFLVFCGALIDIYGQILVKKKNLFRTYQVAYGYSCCSLGFTQAEALKPPASTLIFQVCIIYKIMMKNDHFHRVKWLVPQQAMHSV